MIENRFSWSILEEFQNFPSSVIEEVENFELYMLQDK